MIEQSTLTQTDVVIIGAGPVGLACGIEVKRSGLTCVILEKGVLVNSLIGYPTNMQFFSTPSLLEIGGHPFPTLRYKPIREDGIDYYRKVAQHEGLDIRLHHTVVEVVGSDEAFIVKTSKGSFSARKVIVATGFFDEPVLLNVPGEDLDHVIHYYKEPFAFALQNVVVIGAKNSAAKAALECYRYGSNVTMLVRDSHFSDSIKYWIKPDLENRVAAGEIDAHFGANVLSIEPDVVRYTDSKNVERTVEADAILALTGYRPDYRFLEGLQIGIADDPARTPVLDDETFETTRKGVFLAGTVCGGLNTSRWFIENGRHHAAQIAKAIIGTA